MLLSMKEWLDMQRNSVRVCEEPENIAPKAIFIGTMTEDGCVEAHMKLVSASEWENFETAWRRISGANCPNKDKSLRHAPQFFLI